MMSFSCVFFPVNNCLEKKIINFTLLDFVLCEEILVVINVVIFVFGMCVYE